MDNEPAKRPSAEAVALANRIGAQAARKLKARRHGVPGVWFGLGMTA